MRAYPKKSTQSYVTMYYTIDRKKQVLILCTVGQLVIQTLI